MIKNLITGTSPLAYHANGGADGPFTVYFKFIFDWLRREVQPTVEKAKLDVVTWSSFDEPTILEQDLPQWGVTPIVLRPAADTAWNNGLKISLAVNYLKQDGPSNVLFMDATDTVLLAHPNRLLERMNQMGTDAIMSCEANDYPPCQISVPGVYPFGNSGGLIGQRDRLLTLYQAAHAIKLRPSEDQYRTRAAAKDLNITLDSNARIFQCAYNLTPEHVVLTG